MGSMTDAHVRLINKKISYRQQKRRMEHVVVGAALAVVVAFVLGLAVAKSPDFKLTGPAFRVPWLEHYARFNGH